jgi:hypothetical protein
MRDLDLLYTVADQDYSLPLHRAHDAGSAYEPHGAPADWTRATTGVWTTWTPPGGAGARQGWKVHVSARFERACGVLARPGGKEKRGMLEFRLFGPVEVWAADGRIALGRAESAKTRCLLAGCIEHAVTAGFERHAWQLARTMPGYFERSGHWQNLSNPMRHLAASMACGEELVSRVSDGWFIHALAARADKCR